MEPSRGGRTTLASRTHSLIETLSGARPQVLVGVLIGLVLAIGAALVGVLYDFTAVVVIPFALGVIYLVLRWPLGAHLVFLGMVSIVPIERQFFGFYVPNWTQFLIPALLLGALIPRLFARDERRLTAHWADLFVIGFIVLGYAGVTSAQEGLGQYKWFTNEIVMPMSLYFVARWLPYNRAAFRTHLRWQLLAAGVLMADMVLAPLIGRDILYGNGFRGFGMKVNGVTGTAADTVSYAPIWFPLFLYAAVTALPGLRRGQRTFWLVMAVLCAIATMATTERTGAVAIVLASLVCLAHHRLRRYIAWGLLSLAVVVPVWLTTPIGRNTSGRLQRLGNEGEGFERRVYRDKAWAVINSPTWSPLYGTGFGGLTARSKLMVSETEEIYDYNWNEWRPATVYAGRATHCSPLSLFGEYGYGGILLLGVIAIFFARGFLQAYLQARARGLEFDSTFAVTAVAAMLTIFANGMYHNTDSVIQVIIVIWSFAGLIIGHPEVLIVDPTEVSNNENPEQEPRAGPAPAG